MAFINIGFKNSVNSEKLTGIISPDSAPAKRLVQKAKDEGRCIDGTQGRKTKSILIMSDGRIFLSALLADTITARCNKGALSVAEDKGEEDE